MGRINIRLSEKSKKEWLSRAKLENASLTALIIAAVDLYVQGDIIATPVSKPVKREPLIVRTKKKRVLGGDKIVSTEKIVRTLEEEIEEALRISEPENWLRVKKLVKEEGYEWDAQFKRLSMDGFLVRRF